MRYTKALIERKNQLQRELHYINKLLDVTGDVPNGDLSTTSKVKLSIKQQLDQQVSLRITEIIEALKIESLDFSRSIVHQALKQLRENREIIAYKINGSNQKVYYMNRDGIGSGDYPVKEPYRAVSKAFVQEFEWMDEVS